MSDWPPKFTMTAEGAIRLVLLNYEMEHNAAKTELAMTLLLKDAYDKGYSQGKAGGPKHSFAPQPDQVGEKP